MNLKVNCKINKNKTKFKVNNKDEKTVYVLSGEFRLSLYDGKSPS